MLHFFYHTTSPAAIIVTLIKRSFFSLIAVTVASIALYKQSCRELYIAGHRDAGKYVIDVDRNGPLPPARVNCELVDGNMIATTVVHNVPNELVRTA